MAEVLLLIYLILSMFSTFVVRVYFNNKEFVAMKWKTLKAIVTGFGWPIILIINLMKLV